MNAPEEILIDRFLAVFGEPKVESPDVYIAEFSKAMKGWSAVVLDKAGDEVIRSCKFWPRPAEVIEIARGINASIESDKRHAEHKPADPVRPPPTPAQVERVAAIMEEFRSNMAAKTIADPPSKPVDWVKGQKPDFEKMQRESPNHGLHRVLTHRSRSMSGDRD